MTDSAKNLTHSADHNLQRYSDAEVAACWARFLKAIDRPGQVNLQGLDTVLKAWRQRVQLSERKTAVICLGGTTSFGELDRLSDAFAAYLLTRPYLSTGDRVAIMLPNLSQYLVSILGILKAGMVVVNCNPLYTKPEIQHQLTDAGAKLLITLANLAKTPSEAEVPSLKEVIITELGDMLPQPKRFITNFVVRHIKRMIPDFAFHERLIVTSFPSACKTPSSETLTALRSLEKSVTPKDIAFIQYTGGTTGVSKGALLSHSNIAYNIQQTSTAFSKEWLERTQAALQKPGPSNTLCLMPLPFYHIYSLTCGFLACTIGQGSGVLTLPNPRDFKALIKLMTNPDVVLISLINTLAKAVLNRPEFVGVNIQPYVSVVSGGMPTSEDVAIAWHQRTNIKINEGYGLTEASPLLAVNNANQPNSGFAGYAAASTLIKLRDEEGNDILPGQGSSVRGELLAKGPQIMMGYYNNAEETARVLTEDGYLITGDIATIREDGLIEIVDRKKDMILVSGFNVYPNEIDAKAMATGLLIECAAIGVPDEKTGEKVILYAVPNNPSISTEALSKALAESLTNYKRPSKIIFVDSLPKTPVGKILRREVRKLSERSKT